MSDVGLVFVISRTSPLFIHVQRPIKSIFQRSPPFKQPPPGTDLLPLSYLSQQRPPFGPGHFKIFLTNNSVPASAFYYTRTARCGGAPQASKDKAPKLLSGTSIASISKKVNVS